MENYEMYQSIIKPSRSPPGRLFGPVRTILYALIFVSYGYVFVQVFQKKLSRLILIPFIINLIANGLFTYLRFTKSNLLLWVIDILVVLVTIIITMVIMWSRIRRVFRLQVPYLLRVSFATVLAISIFVMNK